MYSYVYPFRFTFLYFVARQKCDATTNKRKKFSTLFYLQNEEFHEVFTILARCCYRHLADAFCRSCQFFCDTCWSVSKRWAASVVSRPGIKSFPFTVSIRLFVVATSVRSKPAWPTWYRLQNLWMTSSLVEYQTARSLATSWHPWSAWIQSRYWK